MGDKYDQLKSKLSKQFEVFKSQDIENGFFDVVFQLGNEKLYAHKHMLARLSKPFAVMFSERWSSKDEPIKIDNYSFNDFKEFLSHFYFSETRLSNENIFTMVDMAEYYDVAEIKSLCDEFLAKLEISSENVLRMFEFSHKNLSSLFEFHGFMNIKKEIIKAIVALERLDSQEEKFLEAVYKWAEHQAVIKQSLTDAETFDMNQAMKEELAEIMPKIHFEQMDLNFLHKYVVPKGFLFSSFQELSDILQKAKSAGTYVTIVSANGKTLTGKLSCDPSMFSNIYDTIISARDSNSDGNACHQYWNTKRSHPSKSSILMKNDHVKYYLIINGNNNLAVKKTSELIDGNCLLAELDGDDEFHLTRGCKIEALRKF